jgi:ferredoxin
MTGGGRRHPGSRRVTLHLPDGTRWQIVVEDGQYVLEAALAAGLDLPHSCLQGWCLTCAARLLEGEMDQRDSRRYYPADRAAGFVLPCTGRALTDLVLATHAREAMREARRAAGLPYPRGDWGARPACWRRQV